MTSQKLRPAILIISDTAFKDASTDRVGETLTSTFAADGGSEKWESPLVKIVPDDVLEIRRCIRDWSDSEDGSVNLIVTSGGTGFAVRDLTPEVGLIDLNSCDT